MSDNYPLRICTLLLIMFLFTLLIPAKETVYAKPVKTDKGLVQGTVEDGLKVYRGIPYAAPPVGDLRWKAPQPSPKWKGVLPADKFGPASIQNNAAIANLAPPDEDCLYLNVWTPIKSTKKPLAVMVWIHGGGFVAGTPAEQLYHCEHLAKKGVVVVSIGYRLGALGFLAHPALSAENDKHVSGNYGMLDMIAGLKWVKKNISAFGGDPAKVTIFGESAGGIAVSMLCASPLAMGLFHGAISQSGGSFGPVRAGGGPGENVQSLADAEKAGKAWAIKVGASTAAELRKLPADKLMTSMPGQGIAWPVMDGYVIPDDQYKPENIGLYGCSAGGMLTAMSVAWFDRKNLPEPGAVGVLCASIGELVGGDAAFTTGPLNGIAPPPPGKGGTGGGMGYLSDVDPKDPLAYPINSPELVAKFPPTLLITSTRAMEFSAALNSHNVLVKNGVDAYLHVWDALPHAFWYNSDLPESMEVYDVISDFFDRNLHR